MTPEQPSDPSAPIPLEVPRLLVIVPRSLFHRDAAWLEVLSRLAAGMPAGASVHLQVRIETAFAARTPDLVQAARAALLEASGANPAPGPYVLNAPTPVPMPAPFAGRHLPERLLHEVLASGAAGAALPSPVISAAVHDAAACRQAAGLGVAYVVFGPLWKPSWKQVEATAGVEGLQRIVAEAPTPVLALGGVTPERVAPCLAAGARGVAVASGIVTAADPEVALRTYLEALGEAGAA